MQDLLFWFLCVYQGHVASFMLCATVNLPHLYLKEGVLIHIHEKHSEYMPLGLSHGI
jgi:hypothetical protein